MPRVGVSQVEVEDAIHTLETAGLNPSIRLIRQKIGRGSLSTIAAHKRAVEADRQADPGPSLPDPVLKSLVTGASAYWQELVDAAEAEIATHQEKADAAYEALRQARDAALSEANELRLALDELTGRHAELERMASTRSEAITEQKTLLVAAKSARDEQERATQTLARELAEVRSALADAQERSEARGTEVARLGERLAARTSELESLQAEISDRAGDRQAMNDTLAELRQSHRAAQSALDEARGALTAREEELLRLKERGTGTLEANRRLEHELADLRRDQETTAAVHEAQLEERDKRLKDLQNALNDAQVVNRLLARQQSRRSPQDQDASEPDGA